MDIERKIRTTAKTINVVYYVIYLLTIMAVVTVFFLTYANVQVKKIDALSPLGININTGYLVFLLVSIPSSLYLFHRYTIKLRRESDEFIKFSKYKKAAITRLWIVGSGLIIGVILVWLLRSQSMIFTSAIAAIALYFCKPSPLKVVRELDLDVDINNLGMRKYR